MKALVSECKQSVGIKMVDCLNCGAKFLGEEGDTGWNCRSSKDTGMRLDSPYLWGISLLASFRDTTDTNLFSVATQCLQHYEGMVMKLDLTIRPVLLDCLPPTAISGHNCLRYPTNQETTRRSFLGWNLPLCYRGFSTCCWSEVYTYRPGFA